MQRVVISVKESFRIWSNWCNSLLSNIQLHKGSQQIFDGLCTLIGLEKKVSMESSFRMINSKNVFYLERFDSLSKGFRKVNYLKTYLVIKIMKNNYYKWRKSRQIV